MIRYLPLNLVVFALFSPFLAGNGFAQELPNVVLVMTDDQGWGDVEFSQQLSPNPANPADQTYAGHPELKTPQLAAMAAAGMKFDRFYSGGPVCSPTRASFLTGRHHRRTRVDNANNGRLKNRELTIAEIAKMYGYQTGHFGKWHLGSMDKSIFAIDSNRGGTNRLPGSENNYSAPWNNSYDVTFATESKTQTFNPTDLSPETHYWRGFEDALALEDPSLDGDDSEVMMDRVIPFMQSAVDDNKPFLATVWFHTPHLPYQTIDVATLNEFYSSAEQAAMDTNERGYYSALTAMDKQMGRLRQALQDMGVADNTLLLFTSDNGPENGVPYIADLAKGDLRGNKRDLFEGGVRVPAIVEWPGHVAAGTQSDTIAGVVDFLPTLAEIWGFEMPDDRPLDGESMLPFLTGGATGRNGAMYWDYVNSRSIVDAAGQFKAISTNGGGSWQLFDLIADPKESTNLGNSNPNQLTALIDQWNDWRDDVDTHRASEVDYDDFIESVTNVSIDITSPANFQPTEYPATEPVLVLEKQFFTLGSVLPVNSDGSPGTYDVSNPPSVVTLPADTVVHSFLFHFAPEQAMDVECSVTFDNQILGVTSSENQLMSSDFLAFANPVFSSTVAGVPQRGLDFENPASTDAWTISPDRKTITVNFQALGGMLDELRVITDVEFQGIPMMEAVVNSISDARLVGFTTNSRDDNNGGAGSSNLIGLNTEGVDNFTVFEFDLESVFGETTTGANITVTSSTLNNANHGDSNDFIVLNEIAATNAGFDTGSNGISGSDNLTDDGSISFLNRIQYNDDPGPPAGTSQPWFDAAGDPVANLIGAMTEVATTSGFAQGDSPLLSFSVGAEVAQRWIDEGLPGMVLSTQDNGDSRSRFLLSSSAAIVFDLAESILGDVNCDGVVNLLDIGPFVAAVSSGQFNPKADMNGDGLVNLLDVSGFVDVLSGG